MLGVVGGFSPVSYSPSGASPPNTAPLPLVLFQGDCQTREEAVALGVGLCNNGFMHHGNHPFPSAQPPPVLDRRGGLDPGPCCISQGGETEAQRKHGWDPGGGQRRGTRDGLLAVPPPGFRFVL